MTRVGRKAFHLSTSKWNNDETTKNDGFQFIEIKENRIPEILKPKLFSKYVWDAILSAFINTTGDRGIFLQ